MEYKQHTFTKAIKGMAKGENWTRLSNFKDSGEYYYFEEDCTGRHYMKYACINEPADAVFTADSFTKEYYFAIDWIKLDLDYCTGCGCYCERHELKLDKDKDYYCSDCWTCRLGIGTMDKNGNILEG